MTGGFCMHIHSYQIHNVLNVYRRQLSQGTARNISSTSSKNQPDLDRINISTNSQRQSLFDKITSEIVERLTRFEPDAELETALNDQMEQIGGAAAHKYVKTDADGTAQNDSAFTYTLIDKYDQKITQRLPIRQFSSPSENMESMTAAQNSNDNNSDSE
jgi:hypothetical protein